MDDIIGTKIETLKELRGILDTTPRRKIVLLYLYTHWCPKCRIIRFEYNINVRMHGERVQYVSANMDAAPAVCQQLGVTQRDIPAAVLFRNKEMLQRKVLICQKDFNPASFRVPEMTPTPEPSESTTIFSADQESILTSNLNV